MVQNYRTGRVRERVSTAFEFAHAHEDALVSIELHYGTVLGNVVVNSFVVHYEAALETGS